MLMCFCRASCEVLYALLFLVAENEIESLPVVSGNAVKQSWLKGGILGLAGLGWGIKQTDEDCSGCLCAL